MPWLPSAKTLIFRGTQPRRCLILILREGPCKVFNLYHLTYQSHGGVEVAGIEKAYGPRCELASNLSQDCNTDRRIASEPER
jgi:hypothetical protein